MAGLGNTYQPGSRDFGFNVPSAFSRTPEELAANPSSDAARNLFDGVNQVDVRTKNMRALEEGSLPLLLKLLMDPASIGKAFGAAAGPVPGMPQSGLGSFLFGGPGGSTGQASGGQGGSGGAAGGVGGTGGGGSANAPAGGTGGTGPADVRLEPNPRLPDATAPSLPASAADWMPAGTGVSYRPGYLSANLPPGTAPESQAGGVWNLNFSNQPGGGLTGEALKAYEALLNASGGLAGLGFGGLPPNTLPQPQYAFRAGGGPLDPSAVNIVGEQGPEAIVGNQVMPLGSMANAVNPAGQLPNGGTTTEGPGFLPQTGNTNTGAGIGNIQSLLGQNPEQQNYDSTKNFLSQPGGILGGSNSGSAIMQALQPLFQQNLRFGINNLTNSVPSVNNSGAAIAGADVTSRALNDYNLMAAQAMQQGQTNTLGGLGLLGQLAGQAGNGAFNRNLQAGQLSTQRDLGMGGLQLQAQQQAWGQSVNPTLQLLLAALGMATPTAYQTVVKP